MELNLLPDDYSICRLDPEEDDPAQAPGGAPWWRAPGTLSVRMDAPFETTILCPTRLVPENLRSEGPWRCFELQGPLPFELVGVLHDVLGTLASAKISILAFSSFDTDYVLVPAQRTMDARAALEAAGHHVREA